MFVWAVDLGGRPCVGRRGEMRVRREGAEPVDRCALFVDAGYLLADGAMAVHGTRRRDAVSWDYARLLELLSKLAIERTQLPLLRCYWYEATPEGRRSPEHDALADIPGLKLRLGRVRPGRREGVDLMAYRDLTTLARQHAICDAVLVTGDEDMAHAVTDTQDCGVRVVGVHVAVDGNWTISRALRQECDELVEIVASQLRPYVNLLHGADASSPPLSNGQAPPGPLSSHLQAPAGSGNRMRHHPSGHGGHSGPQPMPSSSSGHGKHHSMPDMMPGRPSGPAHLPQHTGSTPPAPPQHPPEERQPPRESGHSPEHHPPQGYEPPREPGQHGQAPGQHGQRSHPRERRRPPREYESPRAPQHGNIEFPHPPQQEHQDHGQSGESSAAPTLSDAVRCAYKEGGDFGESVARDAPALWLEAVLARKPRMPSDLEARLLQGSALPIDFLLHDDVRHSLRRGFWEALEQYRR